MRRFSITKHRRLCNPLAYFPAAVVLVIATLTGWSSAFAVEEKPPLPRWRNLSESEAPSVPEPRREFRGVWIATVYNLDWPSKPGLPVETQQAELLDILDRAAALHLNAIVLQVRTMCDAFYESPLEPWSYYLMGELGQAPEPFWDPLAFAVEAAHQRGLELHAWLNPFRATTAEYGDVMPANHVSSQYPWLTRTSGRHLWLDPSSEFVRNRFLTVAFDIVNRYDIDAIHMDDYFYPYPAKGEEPGLDDEENWQRYRYGEVLATGEEPMDRNEWRRELVNNLIEELYHDIKRTKPWVKLGISPFGIWRPGYPQNIQGMDSYTEIFADSRKWLREGWVDYFSPQLYWKLEGPQSFTELYRWWQDQNIHGRHVWPGIAASRMGSGAEGEKWGIAEVVGQIEATRAYTGFAPANGQLFWHWEAFATNRGDIAKLITKQRYTDRALPPPSPWLATEKTTAKMPMAANFRVKAPVTEAKENDDEKPAASALWRIGWDAEAGVSEAVRWWSVQVGTKTSKDKDGSEWEWQTERVVPGSQNWVRFESIDGIDAVAVRAVDKVGELGKVRVLERVSETSKKKK